MLIIVDARSIPFRLEQKANASQQNLGVQQGPWNLQRDFINAVKGGNAESVNELLMIDPDLVQSTDAVGVSALLHAGYKQHHAIAAFLLERVHDLNQWEAAAFNQIDRLESLLDVGLKINAFSVDGFTALGLSCFFGHPTCAQMLLDRGADPNIAARNDMQVRPLHSAVARAPEEIVAMNVKAPT